jgi:ESS family glutamate:Na+ symporter
VAVGLKRILGWWGAYHYVDAKTMVRVGGTSTDFLVIFGIASINIAILVEYAYPLSALLACGIGINWLLFRVWGPRAFGELWFEKSLYTWGWTNGVMAMAIALLRTVDPEGESHLLDDFALAYLGFGPIEVVMVTLTPILVAQGHGWPLAAAALVAVALVFLLLPYYQRRMRTG